MRPAVIKIAVVGPVGCGKTAFINFATENREVLSDTYIPTIPVRILESEVSTAGSRGRPKVWNVHIYDCSGDSKFEHTWPAISYKLNGTIFVYNPNDKRQAEELNLWYASFYEKPNLSEKSCLVVASRKEAGDDESGMGPDARLSTLFSDIPRIDFRGKTDEIDGLKQAFNELLKRVISEVSQTQDQE